MARRRLKAPPPRPRWQAQLFLACQEGPAEGSVFLPRIAENDLMGTAIRLEKIRTIEMLVAEAKMSDDEFFQRRLDRLLAAIFAKFKEYLPSLASLPSEEIAERVPRACHRRLLQQNIFYYSRWLASRTNSARSSTSVERSDLRRSLKKHSGFTLTTRPGGD